MTRSWTRPPGRGCGASRRWRSSRTPSPERRASREWLPVYAEALGAKRPWRVPKFIARLVAGYYATYLATELRGASNGRAKSELGWQPRHKSWRQGFRE